MNACTYVPWNTVLALALIGCSSDDGGPSQPPADVQVLAGNNQEALVGQLVAGTLRVVVRDAGNAPVRGATVDWVLTVGDGSLSAASSKTDGAGAAQTRLTLGSTPGPRVVTATVGSLGPVTFTVLGFMAVVDPADQFSTGASAGAIPPEITRLSAASDGNALQVRIDFAATVVPEATGGPNVLIALLDLDTDQSAATGIEPNTDFFRPGTGSTGMGADYVVGLFEPYQLVRTSDSTVVGTVTPVFSGTRVALSIPLALLGADDGGVNLAVVVGTLAEPTDIAPNNGNLTLPPPSGATADRAEPLARSTARPPARIWGRWR